MSTSQPSVSAEWPHAPIGSIARVVGGGTPSTKVSDYWEGDVPWITPKDLSNHANVYISRGERNISESGFRNSGAQILPKGTVLVSSRAPIGYVAIAANPVTTNQGFKSLILKEEHVPEFYYYVLKSSTDILESRASGTTFRELSGAAMAGVPVPVPPHDEQRRIAAVLGALDDKIAANRRMNATLEALAQTVFHERFGRYAPGDPLPEGWRWGTVSDLVDVDPSYPLRKGTMASYVGMSSLPTAGFETGEPERKAYVGGARFQNRDTLLARITPCLENGKGAYVYFLEEGVTGFGSTEFIVLRPREGVPSFLPYLISRDEEFRQFMIKNMQGSSGRQRASAADARRFPLPVPPASMLVDLHSAFQPVADKIIAGNRQNRTLAATRDTLLPRLLSGEVRVAEAVGLLATEG